jgi:putative oxidoreductase
LFYAPFVGGRGALGLLVLRVVAGAALMLHGWEKIQDPFGWADNIPGFKPAGFLQALAALAEFGGGIALMAGFLTPLAGLGIACTMGVAIAKYHLASDHPFVDPKGGPSFELAAAYLAVAINLILVGPGMLSVDAFLLGRRGSGKR